ncbi:histidine-type phosphatase [Duganella radicis]|uniref:Multiple inositol polyphosphate phosphatase 1 n=1 Tax=Duganella radicis TaxID=551988 RepID=A0A6L6PLB2_9BURK|nr:histidine-type phosphatase [Duganella radicis]MTV39890.1 histidine-type phosphatase [Duganella radicis]
MLGLALSLLLSTKAPYAPQQDSASYEAAPAGYKAVYTQMLARHGSRGLTSARTAEWLHALWRQAADADALTPLGRELGPDIEQMMRANELLGYGNETRQGMQEHTQLAQRMYARLPVLFRDSPVAGKSRRIVLVSSGKDRAVDSAEFFRDSLVQQQPSLAPLFDTGIDRHTLYFHKLNAAQDTLVTESSLAYQRWAKSDELRAQEGVIHAQPQLQAAAQATLARLFTPAFIATLAASHRDASAPPSATEAALALYDLYAAAADMRYELKADFVRYMPATEAHVYAEAEDAVAFYEKGPGIAENGSVTWRMAASLVDDFFKEADAIDHGDLSHAAKLRFAHAEIVIPFASALGIPGMSEQLSRATTYSYQNSPWRGAQVAPMAANIQWELYRNSAGRVLVRMLYNERETDFKPACSRAKIAPASHFYDYRQLKRCYK